MLEENGGHMVAFRHERLQVPYRELRVVPPETFCMFLNLEEEPIELRVFLINVTPDHVQQDGFRGGIRSWAIEPPALHKLPHCGYLDTVHGDYGLREHDEVEPPLLLPPRCGRHIRPDIELLSFDPIRPLLPGDMLGQH